MNPNQVRLENGSNSAAVLHAKSESKRDSASSVANCDPSQKCGFAARTSIEIGLPGIQVSADWKHQDWAAFLFDVLNKLAPEIRVRVFPQVEDHRLLISLSDALSLAVWFKEDSGESFADDLQIASPCLAAWAVYDPVTSFVHSCFAIYNVRDLLLAELLGKGNLGGDVLLTEALAIAEQTLHYEGTVTELMDQDRHGPTRLQSLATQARAVYILASFCGPAGEQGRGAIEKAFSAVQSELTH